MNGILIDVCHVKFIKTFLVSSAFGSSSYQVCIEMGLNVAIVRLPLEGEARWTEQTFNAFLVRTVTAGKTCVSETAYC